MKVYYYFIFRVYTYYRKDYNESEGLSLYSTSLVSTLFLYFILLIPILYFDYYHVKILNKIITGKISVIFIMTIIGIINYRFFIRPKSFLDYNFKKDRKGGYSIIVFTILLALSFIFIANKNREKIFKEREKVQIENNKTKMI